MNDLKLNKTTQLEWFAHAWPTAIEQLSHILATKMATLQLKQQGLQKVIPSLVKGYLLAVEDHLVEDELSEKIFNRLDDMQNLDAQLMPMFDLLNQFNDYSSHIASFKSVEIPQLNADQCLIDLVKNYPFDNDEQRDLIKCDVHQNFKFEFSLLFIESLLHHLLKITLQYVLKNGSGDIDIWVSEEIDYYIFNFKNKGLSLSEEQYNKLFNNFLFESYDKTRPGLGFCRLALIHIGGDVVCDLNNIDQYTHFKILFPKKVAPKLVR